MTSAILLLNLQVGFFRAATLDIQRAALIRRINALSAIARTRGAPVIWIKQSVATPPPDDPAELGYRETAIASPADAMHVPGLRIESTDSVVVKQRCSAFHETRLEVLLEQLKCQRVILAGVNTHRCVRATALDAHHKGFAVWLARDCIGSCDEDQHQVTMRYLQATLADSVTNEDIAAQLRTAR